MTKFPQPRRVQHLLRRLLILIIIVDPKMSQTAEHDEINRGNIFPGTPTVVNGAEPVPDIGALEIGLGRLALPLDIPELNQADQHLLGQPGLIEELQRQNERLQAKVDRQNERLIQQAEQNGILEGRIGEVGRQNERLRGQNERLRGQNERSVRQAEQSLAEVAMLRGRNEELRGHNEELRSRMCGCLIG